jgi:hypothetical protein
MLWNNDVSVANNMPKFTIISQVNPANTCDIVVVNGANTSTTVIPFASTTGVTTHHVAAAGTGIPAADAVSAVATNAITFTTPLTANVSFGQAVVFSNTISLSTSGANTTNKIIPFASTTGLTTNYIASGAGIPADGVISAVATNAITFTNVLTATVPQATVITFSNTVTLTTNTTVIPFTTANTYVGANFIARGNNVPKEDIVSSSNSTTVTLTTPITGEVKQGDTFRFHQVHNAPLYQNTTPSVFKSANSMVAGVYGVTNTMVNVANTAGKHKTVPGWYLVRSGMGPVVNTKIVSGGAGYNSGTDTIKITSTVANTINTQIGFTNNASGVITALTSMTLNGGLFVNTSTTTVSITTSGGSAASITFTLGGRANRIQKECLVVTPSMVDSTGIVNTAMFPNHS